MMLPLWMSKTNWGFLITFTQKRRGRLQGNQETKLDAKKSLNRSFLCCVFPLWWPRSGAEPAAVWSPLCPSSALSPNPKAFPIKEELLFLFSLAVQQDQKSSCCLLLPFKSRLSPFSYARWDAALTLAALQASSSAAPCSACTLPSITPALSYSSFCSDLLQQPTPLSILQKNSSIAALPHSPTTQQLSGQCPVGSEPTCGSEPPAVPAEEPPPHGAFFVTASRRLISTCDSNVFILITPSDAFNKLFFAPHCLSRECSFCRRSD